MSRVPRKSYQNAAGDLIKGARLASSLEKHQLTRMSNLTLVLEDKQKVSLETREKPKETGPKELQIKVHSVGICGTDIYFWTHGVQKTHVLGHEMSGTVVEVGSQVTNFTAGDRVTIEPAIPCFSCEYCRTGQNNLCPSADEQVVGSPPKDGCLQNVFLHPANLCHKIPESVTFEEGALVEPLACVVHAVQRAGVSVGQSILICGSGPMGLLCLLTAKAFGAEKIVATDINPMRLCQAKKAGADITYLVDDTTDHMHQAREIQHLMGHPPHITFECTGAESSLRLALTATRRGGKVGLVGLGPVFVSVPLCLSSIRQVDLIGCARYNNTFPLAIDLIASKRIDVAQIVTHKFSLKDASLAFETVVNGEGNKVLIQYDK